MLWGPCLVKPAHLALLEDIPEADFQDPIHRETEYFQNFFVEGKFNTGEILSDRCFLRGFQVRGEVVQEKRKNTPGARQTLSILKGEEFDY